MADNARSPSICPWDPGEVCKAAHGACLPPRKRLLAGLKQNGWFSSTPSYFQEVSGASCAPEELRLEVDLTETKHECIGEPFSSESPTCKQGESKAVEKLVSVKSKRATKRRKSLSVLVDCRNSVKNLQPELLKSCSGNEIQERVRGNKVSMESLLTSKREKASVHSYKEMVDAARAAASKAAKGAAEAKAIALEKAAVAAKAAAIARAALEAVALVVEDEELECQPSRHGSCEQNRIGKGEFGSAPKGILFPSLLLPESTSGLLDKSKENKGTWIASLSGSNKDEKTQAGKRLHPVDIGTVLDGIKEDKSEQNCVVALSIAGFDSPCGKHEEAEQTQKTCTVACPMPPPIDDEKLARQLHRAMNSSPRIIRSRASLEYCKKTKTFSSSTEGCTQIRYRQVGGCSSSREKKQIHKDKLRASRSSIGKADIKIKSMTAINDTLNQRATVTQYRDLDSTGTCFAASSEYADQFCHKDDDPVLNDSDHTFVSFTNCKKGDGNFTGNCGIYGSHKVGSKAKGNSGHFMSYVLDSGTLGRDDDLNSTKSSQILRKLNSRRKTQTAVSFLVSSQRWNDNKVDELPSTCTGNQSETPSNIASEQTGSHLETYDEDHEGRDENWDGRIVSGPETIVGGDANETPTVKTIKENLFCSKSSRATRKISHLALHGEMPKRGQKNMTRNFGRSISYLPSPTAL